MKGEITKGDNELCFANVQETVQDNKSKTEMSSIKTIMARPAFKWIAVVILITLVIIAVAVPTVLEMTKKEAKNGNWGNWTSFSDCSHSCGGGTHYRVRNCNNPGLVYGGYWCNGNETDIQSCNKEPCPVHGVLGSWSSFSECSQTCGGGTQTRQRECDSPSPAHGGAECLGNINETRSCNTNVCPVQGKWGSWTEVSGCSHSCDGGTLYRLRMCNNPSPSFGGNWCSGNATELHQCNEQACPEYKSAFTVWDRSNGPTSGTIKFVNVITNIGGHYDTSTGQFTCKYPGLYVFSLHILKSPNYDIAYCHIRKNGSNIIYVHSSRGSSSYRGYYGSSGSVVFYLDHGDTVDIGGCTDDSTFGSGKETTFSGFLLKAD